MIEKLKEKYVFFDIDGTLSDYKYNNKNSEIDSYYLNTLLFSNSFLKPKPLKHMQNIIKNLSPDKIYTLGTIVTNHEINQKYKWLEKNYPTIKKENIIFISSPMLKPDVILEYAKQLNINIQDIVFVDDRLDILKKAENLGITAYHPDNFRNEEM